MFGFVDHLVAFRHAERLMATFLKVESCNIIPVVVGFSLL